MVYNAVIEVDGLAPEIEKVLGRPVRSVRMLKQEKRLYSRICLLNVSTGTGSQKIMVKTWTKDTDFHAQTKAIVRARAWFADRDDVCIPYLGHCENKRLLFMEYIEDQPLEKLLQLPQPMNLRRARRYSVWACAAAGRWLREWHTIGKSREPVGLLLQKYFEEQGDSLHLLDPGTQRRLQGVIDGLGDETVCATHGDFTPYNVLWSEHNKLTVLDFGMHRSSPWRDCMTMEIGLLRTLKFSLRSPGKWLPGFAHAAVTAFWESYGEPEGSPQARMVCAALRHLVLYSHDITAGRAYRKRAEWHYHELRAALAIS